MLRKVAVLLVLLFPIASTAFAAPLVQAEEEGNPWWLWLLVLAVLALFVGFMIWWWLREPEGQEETMTTVRHTQPVPHQEPGPAEAPVAEVGGVAADSPLLDTQETLVAKVEPVETETVDLAAVVPETAELAEVEIEAATADDLIIVEGIGPAIQNVLYASGISTYRQLAATDPDRLRAILRQADPHLARMFDPSTWPEQARLAVEGDWEALETLKGQLKHGRRA